MNNQFKGLQKAMNSIAESSNEMSESSQHMFDSIVDAGVRERKAQEDTATQAEAAKRSVNIGVITLIVTIVGTLAAVTSVIMLFLQK